MNAFSGALGGKKPGGEKGVYAEYSGEFVLIPTALNILANG